MRKKIFLFLLIVINCDLILGCKKAIVDSEDISDQLSYSFQNNQEVKKDEPIRVWIENQSAYCIEFPYDFGLNIFIDNENPEKIINITQYSIQKPIILNSKDKEFSAIYLTFYPDLSGITISKPQNFYAEINGHLCTDESKEITKKIPFVVFP